MTEPLNAPPPDAFRFINLELEKFCKAVQDMEIGKRRRILQDCPSLKEPHVIVALLGGFATLTGAYMADILKAQVPPEEYDVLVQLALLTIFAAAHGVPASDVNAQFVIRKDGEKREKN